MLRTGMPGLRGGAAVLGFCIVAAVLGARLQHKLNVVGAKGEAQWGLIDFRDQLYYPVVAFLDGRNPYDPASYLSAYPTASVFAPYSPLSLVVHSPFGLLPLRAAEFLYSVLTLALVLLVARMALRFCLVEVSVARVFGIATLVMLSRPGHWNWLLGQFAAEATVATYAALHYSRQRPWVAGVGLALTTFKPSFGGPLTVLMLARKDFRAVAVGMGIAAVLQAIGLGVLLQSAEGVGPLLDSFRRGYLAWQTAPIVDAASSYARVDAFVLVGHLVGAAPGRAIELGASLGVLGLGAVAVRRLAAIGEGTSQRLLSASVATLAIAACVYHLAYDLVLLTLPLTALLVKRIAGEWGAEPRLRWALVWLLAFLALNYFASLTAIDLVGVSGLWWTIVTSLNSAALVATLVLFVTLVFRQPSAAARGTTRSAVA